MADPDLQIRRGVGGGGDSVKKFSCPSGLHLVKNKGGSPLDSPLLLLVNMCELRCNILHFTTQVCTLLLLAVGESGEE